MKSLRILTCFFVAASALAAAGLIPQGPPTDPGYYSLFDRGSKVMVYVDIGKKTGAGSFGVKGMLLVGVDGENVGSSREEHPIKGTINIRGGFKGTIDFRGRTRPLGGYFNPTKEELVITGLPLLDTAELGYATRRGTDKPKQNDPMDSVVDTWSWHFAKTGDPKPNGSVTFKAYPGHTDRGTMTWSGGQSGTWRQTGRTVVLQWKHMNGVKDTMTLSKDGKTLEGTNSEGWKVKGKR